MGDQSDVTSDEQTPESAARTQASPIGGIISLTLNEKKVLEYIESYITELGVAPTYQEIRSHFGFASFNSVQRYLKQLQTKGYIGLSGGNQRRGISLRQPASALQRSLKLVFEQKQTGVLNSQNAQTFAVSTPTKAPVLDRPSQELLSLPLLGKVAAGKPIEALTHDEHVAIPPTLVRKPHNSYTLQVVGSSMIEDGIFENDILIVEEAKAACNGEIAICIVDNEATVKRFYLRQGAGLAKPQVELRPSNADLDSMWYSPDQVEIRGIVVGLLRKF